MKFINIMYQYFTFYSSKTSGVITKMYDSRTGRFKIGFVDKYAENIPVPREIWKCDIKFYKNGIMYLFPVQRVLLLENLPILSEEVMDVHRKIITYDVHPYPIVREVFI